MVCGLSNTASEIFNIKLHTNDITVLSYFYNYYRVVVYDSHIQ